MRYRLDELGWLQFETLMQALFKASLGPGVESWAGKGDLGRDCYCASQLPFPASKLQDGPFLFQVKFVAGANAAGANFKNLLVGAVKAEAIRILARIEEGIWNEPSHYVLVTNCPLTTSIRADLAKEIAKVCPNSTVSMLGGQDVEGLLIAHPELRRSFPQLLGLADLSQLIKEQVNKELSESSSAAMSVALGLEKVFVPTSAFEKAKEILAKYSFAVLEGPPEMGKTAIARMIGVIRLLDGWEVFECRSPTDFFAAYEKNRKQFFIADDAFGRTEFDPSSGKEWERELDKILHRLNSDHQLCWTSRKHILERALKRMDLQGMAGEFPKPSAVIVDAAKLDLREKTLMLLRHAQSAELAPEEISVVKKFGKQIVGSSHFTPERIRRFVQNVLPEMPKSIVDSEQLTALVKQAISDPTVSMRKSFSALSPGHRLVLYMMVVQGWWTERDELRADYVAAASTFEVNEPFDDVSDELVGAFLREVGTVNDPYLDWIHPSVRDLVIDQLSENARDRERFIEQGGARVIGLALSELGGEEGKRDRPLLRTKADWIALSKTLDRLVSSMPAPQIHSAIRSISAVDRESLSSEEAIFLQDLMHRLFEGILKRLIKGENVLTIGILRDLCELSVSVFPPEVLPNPQLLWENAVSAAAHSGTEGIDYNCAFDAASLFELVALLWKNEPRFLRAAGFPERIEHVISQIVMRLETYAIGESDWSLDDERDVLDGVRSAVEKLQLLGASGANWTQLANHLGYVLEHCEDMVREAKTGEDDGYEQRTVDESAFTMEMVEAVLADL